MGGVGLPMSSNQNLSQSALTMIIGGLPGTSASGSLGLSGGMPSSAHGDRPTCAVS